MSPKVDKLNRECAGGRVRFSTDSPYIAVRATYRAVGRASHLTLVSTAGFDLYIDGEYTVRFSFAGTPRVAKFGAAVSHDLNHWSWTNTRAVM